MTQNDASGSAGGTDIPGGLPQEPVEDRPNVSTVKPEDYPDAAPSGPGEARSGTRSPLGLDEEMEDERRNPGSSGSTPGGSDDGHRHGGEA